MQRKVAALLIALAVAGGPAGAGETYDLMFREGTLSTAAGTPYAVTLTYAAELSGPMVQPGTASAYRVALAADAEGGAVLTQMQGDADLPRRLGVFPTGAGNPVIMYFLESTLRDVAAITGSSPFYLRNRIKEALLGPADITPASVDFAGTPIPARQVTIHPFAQIPEKARMGTLGDLALSVVVADAVPGWYGQLAARTPDATAPGAYSHVLTLTGATEAHP